MRAALAMRDGLQHKVFSPSDLAALTANFEVDTSSVIRSFDDVDPAELSQLELLITGWESPWIGPAELARMPRLRAIVHAAGSVKQHLHPAVWTRKIVVSTAASANAYPVAEYTLGMLLLAVKDVFWIARDYEHRFSPVDHVAENPGIGGYGAVVGIVGASRVGRRVIELLKPFDFEVLVYDPYLTAADAEALGVSRCDLAELAERCTVLSLHAPDVPATRHMIDVGVLSSLRDRATIINTARAGVIDQEALLAELRTGRLRAILDVTDPEPLPEGHELRRLANVYLTPHLAGAQGNELQRLGANALAESLRVRDGEPLRHPVSLEELARMA